MMDYLGMQQLRRQQQQLKHLEIDLLMWYQLVD